MRLALFSDIHGNSIALDAVLDDIQAQGGVDTYWILGDLVALGPDPVGVLERVSKLANTHFVRGNTDRYIVSDAQPPPLPNDVKSNLELLGTFGEVIRSIGWTQGAITISGWFEWLSALPLEQRMVLPNGTRLLVVHASPGLDDGQGIRPDSSDTDLQSFLKDCHADLVCVGHTHWPMNLRVNGIHLVNLGSVSNPKLADLRASYVILNADSSGYQLEHRRVDYDRAAVITQLQRARHPSAEFISRFMRGEQILWYK